jgi:hypothetical protein
MKKHRTYKEDYLYELNRRLTEIDNALQSEYDYINLVITNAAPRISESKRLKEHLEDKIQQVENAQ